MLATETTPLQASILSHALLSKSEERKIAKGMDAAMAELGSLLLKDAALRSEAVEVVAYQSQSGPAQDIILTAHDKLTIQVGAQLQMERQEAKHCVRQIAENIAKFDGDRSEVFSLYRDRVAAKPLKKAKQHLEEYRHYRDRLIESNMRLVASIAHQHKDLGVDVEDLIQEGTLGLIRATEKFNINKGFRFSTFAYWWIQQAIKAALTEKRGVVRLPANVVDVITKLDRAKQQYLHAYGRYPSEEILASLTGIKPEHIRLASQVNGLGLSLNDDRSREEGSGLSLAEQLASESRSPEEEVMASKEQAFIRSRLMNLNERQRLVLTLYQGINQEGKILTFREIAPKIGVTLERTRQIYHEALAALKKDLLVEANL